tara:strand:- start:526 stop:1020 length:495 start_codon:yes stop_codon:yes gene_type:complete
MLLSMISIAMLVSTPSSDNPAYDAQLQSLTGNDYHAAVELLGVPEARDPREGGGEVWTFRSRSGGSYPGFAGPNSASAFALRANRGSQRVEVISTSTAAGSGSGSSGSGSTSGSTSRVVSGSTSTGAGISATRHQSERICTTRIALNPDGTVDGYAYYGECYPR